ncbi:MAG: hypothetical protein CL823_02290 [Crocinitomicaceae bacterium]|nr:hypothetical protein [Crocinitomicaceae bacterium]
MNTRQKVYALGFLLSLISIFVGYVLLNKEHKNYSEVEPVAEFFADEFNKFVSELTEVERGELGNKVYAVEGEVAELMKNGFLIEGGVVCSTVDSTGLGYKLGEKVRVKGRYISFDPLFNEIRLGNVTPL